jgi:ribose transport system permease protein
VSSHPEAKIKAPASGNGGWQRILASPEVSVIAVIIALMVYMGMTGKIGAFSGEFNRDALARSISLQAILAVAVLLVILTGGIDLSLGSLVAFSGMLLGVSMATMVERGMPVGQATIFGMAIVLVFSLLLGMLHATLVHHLRLPPFVVTLASMSMLRSAALLVNNAVPKPIEQFKLVTFLGNGKVFIAGTGMGLPVSTLLMIGIAIVLIALLGFNRIGRHVYSVGSNEEATRLSGVNVFRVRLFVYGGCSLLTGLAGILYAGYSAQGDPSAGNMFELNAISAAVIGGAALTGGRGTVLGTILGAALLEMILSMINLTLSNPTLWRGMVVGGVLLTAVIFNQIRLGGYFGRKAA